MTYMPTGSSQEGSGSSQSAQRPGAASGPSQPGASQSGAEAEKGLGRILALVAAGLGVLILLLGFSTSVKSSFGSSKANFFEAGNAAPLALLLVAGLIAGVGLLPKQPKLVGVAAAVAVGGFLTLLLQTIAFAISDGAGAAWGSYLELVLGLVLTAAVVGALLIDAGIMSPSPGKSSRQTADHGGGTGQYGPMGGGQYGQQTRSPYGQQAPSQYGQGQGQFAAPQGPSEQSGGYGPSPSGPSRQAQQSPGYYGAPEMPQPYGQQSQPAPYDQQPPYGQPSYGQPQPPEQSYGQPPSQDQPYGQQQPQEQSYGQQQPQEQTYGQPPSPEQGESAGSYSPPTQAFGSHAVEDETTVHPRENPYGPPHQQ